MVVGLNAEKACIIQHPVMSLRSLGGYNIPYSTPNGVTNLIIYDRVNTIGGLIITLP